IRDVYTRLRRRGFRAPLLQKQDYGEKPVREKIYCTVKPLHKIGTACPSVEVYRMRQTAKSARRDTWPLSSPRLRLRARSKQRGRIGDRARQLCDMARSARLIHNAVQHC